MYTMDEWRKIFVKRFDELKTSQGLTQEKLAEALGVTQGTIGHWYRGERKPRGLEQFRRLEHALELAPGTLTSADAGAPYLTTTSAAPYRPSLDFDAIDKAMRFLMDQYGLERMQQKGPAWCAKTIIMLYDLLHTPATAGLSAEQLDKLLEVIEHREDNTPPPE